MSMIASISHNLCIGFGAATGAGDWGEAVIRLALAAVFGGLVGMEREVRGRQAGFRTHTLVCVGSALVMIVSVQFAVHRWIPQTNNAGVNINVDPARVAYGVMGGIGFLGAGAIIHARDELVRGLTTAAALWCVAAIGLCVGFGMYFESACATALVLAVLIVLHRLEEAFPHIRHRVVTVRRPYQPGCIEQVMEFMQMPGVQITGYHYRRTDDLQSADLDVNIAYRQHENYLALERKIEADPLHQLMGSREV